MPAPETVADPAAGGIRPDATALRLLAHPLRSRLLGRLRHLGTATATQLAAELDTNTGATSYHLRRLESAGLVEDTGEGQGKQRIWRASGRSHSFTPSDFEGDDDSETALNWLSRDYVRHLGERSERWLDVEGGWPLEWRDALSVHDAAVVATAAQVQAMYDEIDDVVKKYRRVGQGNPAARRVAVWTVMYPIDLDRPPRAAPAP